MNQQPSFFNVKIIETNYKGNKEREFTLKNLLSSDKVKLIRLELAISYEIPFQDQRELKFNGEVLDNERRLIEYHIENDSELLLFTFPSLMIKVKLHYGQRIINHSIDTNKKINEFRSLIYYYCSLSPIDQVLVIDGEIIGNNDAIGDNELTLSTYGFTDNQLVTMMNRLENLNSFQCTVIVKIYSNPTQSITLEVLRSISIEDLRYLVMKSQKNLKLLRNCFTYSGHHVSEDTQLFECSMNSTIEFEIIDRFWFDASLNERRFLINTPVSVNQMVTLNRDDTLDNIRLKLETKFCVKYFGVTYHSLNGEELSKTAMARDVEIPSVIDMKFYIDISVKYSGTEVFFNVRFDQIPTVREVKQMIERNRFWPIKRQVLYFNRNELTDDQRIPARLAHTGHLELIIKSIEKFKIYVDILNNVIDLGEFARSDEVYKIKGKINFAPNDFQYLVTSPIQPSQLIDHLTIEEHELDFEFNEYTLYLLNRLDKRLNFQLNTGLKGPVEVSSFDSLDWMRKKVIGNVPCKVYVSGQEITRNLKDVKLGEYPDETVIYFRPVNESSETSYPILKQIFGQQTQNLNVPRTTSFNLSTLKKATHSRSSSTSFESPSTSFQQLYIQSPARPIPQSIATSTGLKRPVQLLPSQSQDTQPPVKLPHLDNQQIQSISTAGLSSLTQSSSIQKSPLQMPSGLSLNQPFQQQGPSTSTQSQDVLMTELSLDQTSTHQIPSTSQDNSGEIPIKVADELNKISELSPIQPLSTETSSTSQAEITSLASPLESVSELVQITESLPDQDDQTPKKERRNKPRKNLKK